MFHSSVILLAVLAAVRANIYYGSSSNSPAVQQVIQSDIENNDSYPLAPSLQTIVLVHGHQEDVSSPFNVHVRHDILNNRAANVIIVDWSLQAKQSYSNAVNAVPHVATALTDFLIRLATQERVFYNNLHLVGFNLGAHVVGMAGRSIFTRTGVQVARITGLDPSGSQWGSSSARLTSTDAAYVEVIHTDGSGLLANGIGTPLGDIDFFVNGGTNQPGCLSHACNHARAYDLFAATFFRTEQLLGHYCATNLQLSLNRCTSRTVHVGDEDLIKVGVPGIYRVNTGRTYPY